MTKYIASRRFLVAGSNGKEQEDFIVGVTAPYSPAEGAAPLGLAGCKVYFGDAKDPAELEVTGADELEALENAVWYLDLFCKNLATGNKITLPDGNDLLEAFPSEFSKQYRSATQKGFSRS